MLFMEFDRGAILRKETGLDTSKIVSLVIGNPPIMKEMVKHVPDAGSYAPVTICWMNGQTVCILRMTRWPAFRRPTEVRRHWLSLRIRIPKSSAFFESRRSDDTAVAQ
jgi:uncharacterized protein (DUF302 family)